MNRVRGQLGWPAGDERKGVIPFGCLARFGAIGNRQRGATCAKRPATDNRETRAAAVATGSEQPRVMLRSSFPVLDDNTLFSIRRGGAFLPAACYRTQVSGR